MKDELKDTVTQLKDSSTTRDTKQGPRKADTCNRIKGKIVAITDTWITGAMTTTEVAEDHVTNMQYCVD